ncbi:MAG: sensor histidine kinase [Desulfuromonadales bacterium]
MRIRTRLQVVAAAAVALVVTMALLLYWSQDQLAAATSAGSLADEIAISLFERSLSRSDYLRNDNQRARMQWGAKQRQVDELIKRASTRFDPATAGTIIDRMRMNNTESAAVFAQIVANRDSAHSGRRRPEQATEIENQLEGQLLLKTYDIIADTRNLQEAIRARIAATQQTVTRVSLAFIAAVAFLVIIASWSLGRLVGKGIANLQLGAAAIGAGDFRHVIPVAGEDEFAEVARAFNRMSGALAESRAALEEEVAARKRNAERIEQLNRELSANVSQLLGANQELDAFAYAVSHDLRAPLRAMAGFSQALLEDFADKLDGEARDYLDEIIIGSRHMGQLIDGLLTLSRSTRGELRHDPVDVSAMAERIRRELELPQPKRRVTWHIEPGLCATGDERMIEIVMRNLLDNAWKYTAGNTEPVIRVSAEMEGSQRFFCVADNGAGFDMAHAGKLFQPFQRLHRQDEFPGIGIGLATVQRIVHRHGGTLHGAGAPGKGATFRFSLPGEGGAAEYPQKETA